MQRAWRSGSLALLVAALAARGASAQAARPCNQVHAPPLVEAVAEARRHLASRWLEVGDNLYIAYRMRSPAANPFDLTKPKDKAPKGKDSEEGYIWVGGLECRLSSAHDDAAVVTFIAGAASFVEKKGAWTRPMRQRELTEIVLTRRDTAWIATERRGEYSLLTADDELRKPVSAELPTRNSRIGIPCAADQVWNGKRCAAANR